MKRRTYLAGLAGAALPALAGCTGGGDSGGPTLTVTRTPNPEPTETESTPTESTTEAATPTLEWDAVAGAEIGDGYHYPAPRLVDGTLVVAAGLNDAGIVEGYTPEDGEREWTTATGVSMNSHHPLPAGDSVIVEGTEAGLEAIRASDGESAWTEDVRVYGDPLPVDGSIYIPTGSGIEARAFDGEQLWTWESDSSTYYVGGGGETVYTKAGTSLYALDTSDGSAIWDMRTTMELSTPPLVYDDLLILGRDNGHVTALNTETQEEEWDVNLEQRIATPITAGESTIYAAGWSRTFYALDPSDGSTKWEFDPDYQTTSPAVEHEGTVYVGGTDQFFARDAEDGSPEWALETGSSCMAPPLIDEGTMYLTTEAGGIYRLSLPE